MAMDFISERAFEKLVSFRSDVCISIYLQMARKGADVQGNSLKLKNSLKDVTNTLEERGWRQPEIVDLLSPARRLVEDSMFWQHQQDGLAIFIAPDFFEVYRLPLQFEVLTLVSSRFHVKPLLPLMHDNGQFYILALSQNKVRLFQGTRNIIEEVEAEQLPKSKDEALAYDDPEERLQHHTTTSGSVGGPQVVHHGHSPIDEKRPRLRRFVKQVADGVMDHMGDNAAPLVLAAVDYLHPMFREAFGGPPLLEDGIEGNPDNMSETSLREQAWEIVEPEIAKPRKEAQARYESLAHGEQAMDDLQEIVPAAFQGRIDTLLVAAHARVWGQYEPDTNTVTVHEMAEAAGEDLLDFAAVQTLANGGTVYALAGDEVPGKDGVAAILRF